MKLPSFDLSPLPKSVRFDIPRVADPRFEVSGDTIEMFDAIGEGGITVAGVTAALRPLAGRDVTVQINSPGGSYYDGAAIYNALRAHDGAITVQVLGIAASAASIIAMAGDRIEMARNAEMMIHRVWAITIGNEEDHAESMKFLQRLDRTAAKTYAARSGKPESQISGLMRAETFLTAQEAIDLGLADVMLARDADPKRSATKAATPIQIANKRELSEFLHRAGLSKVAAQRVASGGFSALNPKIDAGALAQKIRATAAAISRT